MGVTSEYEKRIAVHMDGLRKNCYTYNKRPLQVVRRFLFDDVLQAIAWEKTLKKWSRAKKEALIKNDQSLLESLSKAKNISRCFASKAVRYIRYRVRFSLHVMVRQSSP